MGGMRFSFAELFWLTFWLSILISLWRFTASMNDSPSLDNRVEQMLMASVVILTVGGLGSLNGRPKTGAVIGVLVAMLVLAYTSLMYYGTTD